MAEMEDNMKKISVFLVLGMMLNIPCYADSIDKVTQNIADGTVSVTGKYDDIKILRPDFVLRIDDENDNPVAVWQYEKKFSDGIFEFNLPLSGESGRYTVTVNSNVFDNALTTEFDYYSFEDIENILNKVNSAQNTEEITICIEDSIDVFNIDKNLIENLNDKKKVYNEILENKPYETAGELLNTIIKSSVSQQLYENKNSTNSVKLMEEYEEVLGIKNELLYPIYSGFEKEDKTVLAGKIALLKNEGDFSEVFSKACILTEIQTADAYGDVGSVLKTYKDIVYSSEIDKYYKKTNTSSVDIELVGKNFESIEELKKAITEKLGDSEKNTGKGNGSSGGGGGGSTTLPPVYTKPTADKDVPVADSSSEISYTDIADVEWAQKAILELSATGVLNGKGDGIFAPNDYIKREEMVKVLVNAFKIDIPEERNTGFFDVVPGAWYEKYIAAGVDTGAVKGISEEYFGVGEYVTRQDMVLLAYRFAKLAGINFTNCEQTDIFIDKAAISSYADEAISYFSGHELIKGMDNGCFEPKQGSTRAQTAVLIYRLINFANGGQS